jgi:hypothetical protein
MTEQREEVRSEDVVRVPEDDDDGDEVRRELESSKGELESSEGELDLEGEVESEGEVAKPEVAPSGDARGGPLLADEEASGFRSRWNEIQVRFVDEPRGSVQKADSLVVETMERLAETFSDERTRLESQWERGDDVSTEDLRIALQRYRSVFERLLSA